VPYRAAGSWVRCGPERSHQMMSSDSTGEKTAPTLKLLAIPIILWTVPPNWFAMLLDRGLRFGSLSTQRATENDECHSHFMYV
jgi:hypothetical protein